MWADSGYARPVSSYQNPVPVPGVNPEQEPFVSVAFNRAWLGYIVGSLKQLLLQSTWDVATPGELALVQEQAFNLLNLFSLAIAPEKIGVGADEGVELMIRQNPTNPCILESSIDGVNWCQWADISKCNAGSSGQPPTQPPPSGGTATYPSCIPANGQTIVPTVCNTGDVIHFQWDEQSAWNDPTRDALGWTAPDGNVWFAGRDTGLPRSTQSGDPLNSVAHMSLLCLIAGAYYDLGAGDVTVPGGVANAQIILQANDDVLAGNNGQICGQVVVTNNQGALTTHVFDFTTSPFSSDWNPVTSSSGYIPQPSAQWVAGQGYKTVLQSLSGTPTNVIRICEIECTKHFTITSIQIEYTFTNGSWSSPGGFYSDVQNFDATNWKAVAAPTAPTGPDVNTTPQAIGTRIFVHFQCGDDITGADPGGEVTITKITLTVSGTDPF